MERWLETASLYSDGGYHVQTDYHDETPTLALLRSIAALEDCDMRDLPCIWDTIDCEALNRLMATATSTDQDVTVKVDIEDYTAIVRDDGTITVHENDSRTETSDR